MASHRSDIMLLGCLLRITARVFVRDLQYALFSLQHQVMLFPLYLI